MGYLISRGEVGKREGKIDVGVGSRQPGHEARIRSLTAGNQRQAEKGFVCSNLGVWRLH
jgi:hypothetical protein